jgi:hypothetical protein
VGEILSFFLLSPHPPSKIGNPGQVHIEFVRVDEDKAKITDDRIQQRPESHMIKWDKWPVSDVSGNVTCPRKHQTCPTVGQVR